MFSIIIYYTIQRDQHLRVNPYSSLLAIRRTIELCVSLSCEQRDLDFGWSRIFSVTGVPFHQVWFFFFCNSHDFCYLLSWLLSRSPGRKLIPNEKRHLAAFRSSQREDYTKNLAHVNHNPMQKTNAIGGQVLLICHFGPLHWRIFPT